MFSVGIILAIPISKTFAATNTKVSFLKLIKLLITWFTIIKIGLPSPKCLSLFVAYQIRPKGGQIDPKASGMFTPVKLITSVTTQIKRVKMIVVLRTLVC